MKRNVRFLVTVLVGCVSFAAVAQVQQINPNTAQPVPTVPRVDSLPANMPPGPTITDWQPRGHVAVGGTLTLTGPALNPGSLIVVIGPSKKRLHIVQAQSTATRVVLDISQDDLAQGTLAVGFPNTAGTVLDTNYAVTFPQPSLASADAGADIYPFVKRSLTVTVREFPGTSVDGDEVGFGGTCHFAKQSGVTYVANQRAADLSIRVSVIGYFTSSGTCDLQMTLKPHSETGALMPSVVLSAPFVIKQPVSYTFNDTRGLANRLAPLTSTNAGLGSICTGTLPNGNVVGQTEIGADFAVIERGGPGDVSCGFRTKEWLLPEGVRLKQITWRVSRQGNRCQLFGSVSSTLPLINILPTRGTVFVKPEASMLASDFFAFGDKDIVYDGVSYATNLSGPRTLIVPMTLAVQCASMALPLQTSSGTSFPTTDPQSYAIILDSVVLEGPPGLTLP